MQRVTMWMTAVLLVVGPPCVWGVEGEVGVGNWSLDLGEVLGVLSRERRDDLKQNPYIAGFSWEERVKLIRLHNAKRRLAGASNMRHITWDTNLEKMMQDWIGDCSKSGHSSNSYLKTKTFWSLGENLWSGKGGYTEERAVVAWDAEKQFYSSSTFTCQVGKECGHYTQVVWANTYAIGCGVKYCDPWYRVGCMYGPGGNVPGKRPFLLGVACTACTDHARVCDNGLCRPDLTCNDMACPNNGQLLKDVCECEGSETGFSGTDTGSAAFLVASPVMTVSLLALAVLALRQY